MIYGVNGAFLRSIFCEAHLEKFGKVIYIGRSKSGSKRGEK